MAKTKQEQEQKTAPKHGVTAQPRTYTFTVSEPFAFMLSDFFQLLGRAGRLSPMELQNVKDELSNALHEGNELPF